MFVNMKNLSIIKTLVLLPLFAIFLTSCNSDSGQDENSDTQTDNNEKKLSTSKEAEIEGWDLIWQDEFNSNGQIDTTKWSYRIWKPGRVNNELQAYTNSNKNSYQKDGYLTITALNDSSGGFKYTSARLVTDGKFDFKYGKVEARAKLPGGRGSWPAIWMLGSNIHEVGWPKCGEIDIMEYVGYNPDVIHGTAHAVNFYWKIKEQQTKFIDAPGVEKEFHNYGIEWYEDKIDFLFDGKVFFTATPKGGDINDTDAWPFSLPHFLILNVAVGGVWGGEKGIDDNAFPMSMQLDYIRVYQKSEVNQN